MVFRAISHQPSAISRLEQTAGDEAEELFELGLVHLADDALSAAAALGVAYLKRAAELGHAGAHFEVGQAYRFGRGVAEDMDMAWSHYLFAATHGHAEAALTLGVLYETGQGLPQCLDLAHAFYTPSPATTATTGPGTFSKNSSKTSQCRRPPGPWKFTTISQRGAAHFE
jgi:TPR repeat protein